jgi:four helix bundle protein
MGSYEQLTAWQVAHQLVLVIYRHTEGWPPTESYALTSQARRAALSVAVNIAEGSAKRGPKEFRRFLDISLGSLSELQYILRLANDLGYLSREQFVAIERGRHRTGQLLWGLYRSLRQPAAN